MLLSLTQCLYWVALVALLLTVYSKGIRQIFLLHYLFNKMLQSFILPNLAFIFHFQLKYFHKCTYRSLKISLVNSYNTESSICQFKKKKKVMKKRRLKINIIKICVIIDTKSYEVSTSQRRQLLAKIFTYTDLTLVYQS